ncbi:type IV pilus assembly protein PilV [Variovorax boronicumulans]|nr:type IV pilus assembly protein PilV [Variovorax boronicumulans]
MRKSLRKTYGKRQSGIALLEVLVSILLFSLGILGLIGLQARAISLSTDAQDRNRAALLANDVASAMWLGKSVAAVDTGAGSAWQKRVSNAAGAGLPSGLLTITPVTGTTNSAEIQITWRAPDRASTDQQPSTLTTRVTLP